MYELRILIFLSGTRTYPIWLRQFEPLPVRLSDVEPCPPNLRCQRVAHKTHLRYICLKASTEDYFLFFFYFIFFFKTSLEVQLCPTKRNNSKQGPGYHFANRHALTGVTETPAMNERPFMTWKDTFRSNMGYRTWDSDNRVMLSPRHGIIPPLRTPNMALGKLRAKRSLYISEHGAMHFNAQVPGIQPSNTAAQRGPKTLSHKWVPLEMADDGIMYIHPTSREILEWGHKQLKSDAQENGEDPDVELLEKIDDVLQHDPIQPYHAAANQRKLIASDHRDHIIRQEMRLHERRRQKGLPTPPIVMPQYRQDYPDTPDGEHNVPLRSFTLIGTKVINGVQMGPIRVHSDNKTIAKRSKAYISELERQGITVPKMYRPADGRDQYQTAVERNLKHKGSAPLEATVVSGDDDA